MARRFHDTSDHHTTQVVAQPHHLVHRAAMRGDERGHALGRERNGEQRCQPSV
jgi:hypothetical protein